MQAQMLVIFENTFAIPQESLQDPFDLSYLQLFAAYLERPFINRDVDFVSYVVDTTTYDLQYLVIEIFRVKMDISKQIMNQLVKFFISAKIIILGVEFSLRNSQFILLNLVLNRQLSQVQKSGIYITRSIKIFCVSRCF